MLTISGNTFPAFLPFFTALLVQINDPTYNTHLDHRFSPDFLYVSGITFRDGVEIPINSACEDGPRGNIPPMDFIIVGAGCAGSILANKLAVAFPRKTVLLIEAGGDGFINALPPGTTGFNFRTEANFMYHAEPSPNYGNFIEEGAWAYAGKGLGGGSVINGMNFVCGPDIDYNQLAEQTGDDSWNAENMFKNIKEFTNVDDEVLMSDPECQKYLGTEGPLTVSFYNESLPRNDLPLLMRAGEAAGYEILKDINCGKWKGFVQFRGTIKDNERNSAGRAFLAPMRNARNLMILKNSFIKNLIMRESEVVGVLVQTKREECAEFSIHANNEVIISAGAFNSPGILLRSGIGRKEDLDEINIQQVHDLNVGRNYKDHFQVWNFIAISPQPQAPQTVDPLQEYLIRRRGSLSHIEYDNTHAFFNVNGDGPYPDITWDITIAFPVGTFNIESIRVLANFKEKYFTALDPWTQTHELINIQNVILPPKSTGRVTTKDNHPVIYGNYNSHPDDIQTMILGFREIEKFIETPFMRSLNATIVDMNVTECNEFDFKSDDYLKCYMKIYSTTSFHPVGTCKMGKTDDPNAVVDSRLKVIGLKKLRVVDASILPEVPRANTMCPVYAVGWNAAKMIIEDNLNGGDDNFGSKLNFNVVLMAFAAFVKFVI